MKNTYTQRGLIFSGVLLFGFFLKFIGQQTYDRGLGAFKSDYEPQFISAYQRIIPSKGTPCEVFSGLQLPALTTNVMSLSGNDLALTAQCMKNQGFWTEEQSIDFLNNYNEAKGQNGIMQGFLGNSLVAIGFCGALSQFLQSRT